MRGLKQARERRGVTRRQLSEATGIPVATIKTWELGYREAGIDKAAIVADALGCPVSELVGDVEVPDDAVVYAYARLSKEDKAKVAAFIAGLQAAKR